MRGGQAFAAYRALLSVGLVCSVLVVSAHEGLSDRIAVHRSREVQRAVLKVLPGAVSNRSYVFEPSGQFLQWLPADQQRDLRVDRQLVYAGYDESEKLVGIAVQAQGMGYQDVVSLMYGYDPASQQVVGLHIVDSRETPGLGDKIETDRVFVEQFRHLSVALDPQGQVSHPLEVSKSGASSQPWQVDIVSGATVSSRAVVNIVSRSTMQWGPRLSHHQKAFE